MAGHTFFRILVVGDFSLAFLFLFLQYFPHFGSPRLGGCPIYNLSLELVHTTTTSTHPSLDQKSPSTEIRRTTLVVGVGAFFRPLHGFGHKGRKPLTGTDGIYLAGQPQVTVP